MRRAWRFAAGPGARSADLISALDATSDERRAALAPRRAWWLLSNTGVRWIGGATADGACVRALVEDAARLGRLGRLDDRELLRLLEAQVLRERLLVVPLPDRAHLVPEVVELAAPPPSPAAAAAAPAAPPAPSSRAEDEPRFDEVAAQVQVLLEAARLGVPFCEECARR